MLTVKRAALVALILALCVMASGSSASPAPRNRTGSTTIRSGLLALPVTAPVSDPLRVGELAVANLYGFLEDAKATSVVGASVVAQEPARAPGYRPGDSVTNPTAVTPAATSGPHSDAWWSGVAQCEQGGRNDPYYGFFSFMDGSAGGKSWAEQVAMGNALLASVGHEVPTWAAACVAAGYNASPGG